MADKKVIAILVIIQLALCMSVASLFPISLDEPFSIYHSQFPLNEMIPEISQGNNSPLHFLLLHFWIKLGGIGVFWVRLLSIIISAVSVIYLYKLGRKFWRKEFAVILVGLFMLSRLDHYVAMEARMYGLFTLFFILILYDSYRLLFENKSVFIQLGLWNALLLYTHYLGGVVILMECLVFIAFFSHWKKAHLSQVVLSAALTGLLFTPGLQIFFNRASDFQASGTWVPEANSIDLWTNLVKLMNNQFTLFASLGVLLILWLIGKKQIKTKKQPDLFYFSLWFFGTYLLMFVISLIVQPIFFIKYLQFLTVPLFLLLVALADRINLMGKKRYYAFLLLVPFLASFKPIPDIDRNTDELVAYVKDKRATADCTIYYCPPHYELTLAYHYNSYMFEDYEQTSSRMRSSGFIPIYSAEDIGVLETSDILYIDFDSKLLYPNNGVLEHLDSTLTFIDAKIFDGGFTVYNYGWFKQMPDNFFEDFATPVND